jgi:TRAP-type C4-dicarboxylate transport system permease small subunit
MPHDTNITGNEKGSPGPAARIARAADAAGAVLEAVTGAFCVACFAAMTLVTILGVFFRYVMKSPFMWTEEVARYLLVWMGFTAISIAFRQRRHIKVEALPRLLPQPVVTTLHYFVDVVVCAFLVILFHQGILMTKNTLATASTFPLSMRWILAAVPAAAALSLIQIALLTLRRALGETASGNATPNDPPSAAPSDSGAPPADSAVSP